MKKSILVRVIATFLVLAASSFIVQAQMYSNAVMGLNPAGYWPLNETAQPPQVLNLTTTNSGTLGAGANGYYGAWYQASGNQWYLTNDIVTEASPITNGDRALNCQFKFGQYIILPRDTNGVPNGAITIKPPFSIEAWVQVGTTAGQLGNIVSEGEVQMLAGGPNPTNPFYGGTGPGTSWAGFALGQFANFFFFDCFETNAYNNKGNELDGPKNLTVGQWVHLVVTYNGTQEVMYENGAQVGSKTVGANAAGITYVPDPTSPLMIGSGSDVPIDYGVAFTGGLAEVAVYNELLPQSSISAHYQTAGGTNSTFGTNYSAAVLADKPIIYYRMNDNQTVTNAGYPSATFPVAANYGTVGVAANGVYQPGTTPGVAGPSYAGFGANSRSVAINGWLGAVDVGSSNIPSALNPTGVTPMTVVSWFQTGPADAPGRFQEILGHSDSSYRLSLGQVPNIDAHFNPGPGPELQFSSPAQSATNGFAFNDGQWHMAAGVSDGTNEYLYLDGALALSNNTATGINIAGTSRDLLLGGDPQYTYANVNSSSQSIRNFDGQIAQVSFWTNALNAGQIQSLFNAAEVPPYFWQQPVSFTGSQGQNVTISTGVRGSGNVTYQWYQNGVAVSGQTGSTLSFSPATTNNAGSYYLVATGSAGSTTSSIVNIVVYGAPDIMQQTPTELNIFSNSSPTLRVSAVGATLSYQWGVNGSSIPGATNSTYTLTNIQTGGIYTCSLTNVLGTNAIAPISVTVLPDPTAPYPAKVLSNQPMDYFRLDEVSGTTAYDYVGGNNGTYTNVTLGVPGYNTYNAIQTDPSETAAEFGDFPPANNYMGDVPTYLNFGVPNGGNAEFTVEAWATQFFIDGTNGDCIVAAGYGGGGEQFDLDTGGANNSLRFFVRNSLGNVYAANATNNIANDGYWHHLVGVCDEAGGHVYIYMDGALIGSGTIPAGTGVQSLTVPLSIGGRESANNEGTNYDLQFAGQIDDVSLYSRAFTAAQVQADYYASGVAPFNVTVSPANVMTNQGANVTFTSTALGSPTLSYQWFDEHNNPIPGQTNSSMVLSNLLASQSGAYSLTVTNIYGSTNVQASLTVVLGPAKISQDIANTNIVVFANDLVTLSIQASGSLPIVYQWYQDGVAIPSATNASYAFNALQGTNSYYCSVTNGFSYSQGTGPAYSSVATVVGEPITTVNPTNFNSRMKITFSGYNRDETLECFPVLVQLSAKQTGFSYGAFASPNGADLRFADSSGTRELPYEIDQWNDSNGVSSVWVQVPQLSSTNTSIWAYWGNGSATSPPAYTTNGAVWEPAAFLSLPGYNVVYHLKENGFPYRDSTLNYLSTNGIAPESIDGLIGNGELFDGASTYLDAGTANLGNMFTMSAWVNLSPNNSSCQTIWANQRGGFGSPGFSLFVNFFQSTNQAVLLDAGDGTNGSEQSTATGLVSYGQWHFISAGLNGTNGSVAFYVDGTPAPVVSGKPAPTDFITNADLNLGCFTNKSLFFNGTMDEARIHAGIDDSNWVWASYMTVASNTVFSAYSSVTNSIVLPINISIEVLGNKEILTWPEGTLQSAGQVTGPYTNVNGATSPYTNTISGAQEYYRVQAQY